MLPSTLRYGRRRWKERKALLLVELDPRLGIDGKSELERRKHIAPEKADFPVAFTKLAMQRRPAYSDRGIKDVKAIGEPDIEVDRHRAIGNLTDCRLSQRQRMLDQGLIEAFV